MTHPNIRQKLIACFCLHLLFYGAYGITFLKDFNTFNEDVSHLIQAENLSNICLEIRRYEKNFIIRHDLDDYDRVGLYIDEAQAYIPQMKRALQLIPQANHLEDLQRTLTSYRVMFQTFSDDCSPEISDQACPSRMALRDHGQKLVKVSEQLVQYEQEKINSIISEFRTRMYHSIILLALLSIFTLFLIYSTIVLPLKSIEKAASAIAAGTFRQINLSSKKHDEVTSVLRAFNNMVNELETQQEQLFQAKKLSSIGTLASGTAHQINNPLNNIATSCQLAMAEVDPESAPFLSQMLQNINQETQRAGQIVRGLLEFSRSQTFSMQAVKLKTVVDKTMQLVASEAPAGVTITQNIPEDITLFLDIQKMTEALLNLVINGVQAIEEPPGQVTIAAHAQEDHVILTIEDTGRGIDEENIAKIFDPFFSTKKDGAGTGLGLSVAYGIIKKHHGSTKVESTKGKGTKFTINLPLSLEANGTA